MDQDELEANPYNPNGVGALEEIQKDLDIAPERDLGESDKDYYGRTNRTVWKKFQRFGKNALTETMANAKEGWGMFEVDQDILRSKLKSMTRMVHDHPELQGNIGTLKRFTPAFLEKYAEEQERKKRMDDSPQQRENKPGEPKTRRKRMKRQMTPTELAARNREDKPMVPYMGTSMSRKYADEESRYESLFHRRPKEREGFFRKAAFPLYMNGDTDSNTEQGRQAREARFPKEDVESRKITALPFTGNHELGHMLNYLLIKEKNRGIKNDEKRENKNIEDAEFHITADKLVEKALKRTMPKRDYERLVRYKENSLGEDEEWDNSVQLGENEVWESKAKDPAHKKGQINLNASGLSEMGYTTKYGASSASEFFAEAFADVYRNGKTARRTSIELVKIYEEEMKKYKKK